MVCASLRHRGEELLGLRKGLEAYADKGSTFGIPLLYPWANRLEASRFECLGREVDLAAARRHFRADGETGLPIHGARIAGGPWTVERSGERSITASFDWGADPELLAAFPFEHRVEMAVALDAGALRYDVRVEGEAPVACGFHPYFALAPGTRFGAPVRERLVLDERKLPTGEREPVDGVTGVAGEDVFDDAFTAPDGPCVAGPITVTFERGFGYCQVFAPPGEDVVAFEPMTAPANALVSGRDLPVAPHEAAFRIEVRP